MNAQGLTYCICIVNYNGAHWLKDCLDSIQRIRFNPRRYKVVVVDNGSNDESEKIVNAHGPNIEFHPLKKNTGFARANNIGASISTADVMIFLNNDTIVEENLLEIIDQYQSQVTSGNILGVPLVYFDNPEIANSLGISISLIGSGFDRGFRLPYTPITKTIKEVPGVSGAALIISRIHFINLGGFDETYFMYNEDVDLCLRNWMYGNSCKIISGTKILHRVGATSGKHRNAFRTYYSTRNRLRTAIKNFQSYRIYGAVIGSVIFDALISLRFLLAFDVKSLGSIITAYWNTIVEIPMIFQQRSKVQKKRKRSDKELSRSGIIDPLAQSIREFIRLFAL